MNKNTNQVQKIEVIDEHKRLSEMLDSVLFFIENLRTGPVGIDTFDLLIDRMSAHFAVEERAVQQFEQASYEMLHNAHESLLSILQDAKRNCANGDDHGARQILSDFVAALEVHDRDVDTPLFRRLNVSIS